MQRIQTIVTHNGVFHADDVFAYVVLKQILLMSNIDVQLIRTRNIDIINEADYVFDVGGIYNEDTNRFDHHQKGGPGIVRKNEIPYSSFGLVWKKFGTMYCNGFETIANKVDSELVSGIDAIDNGIEIAKTKIKNVKSNSISNSISEFNPVWYEDQSEGYYYDRFLEAAKYAKDVLDNKIRNIHGVIQSEHEVNKAVVIAHIDNKDYIVLDYFVPWKESLLKNRNATNIKFVVYPDISGEWRIMTIPISLESFEARKNLPESWAGLKDDELNEVVGITDAVFCHNGKFIAGAVSKESILKMAEIAIF